MGKKTNGTHTDSEAPTYNNDDNQNHQTTKLLVNLGLAKPKQPSQYVTPTNNDIKNSWDSIKNDPAQQNLLVNLISDYPGKNTNGIFAAFNSTTQEHIQKIGQQFTNSWRHNLNFNKKKDWLDKRLYKSKKWWQALWLCNHAQNQSQTILSAIDEETQDFTKAFDLAQPYLLKNETFERQYQKAFSSNDNKDNNVVRNVFRSYQHKMGMINSSFPLYHRITDPKQRFYVYLLRNKAQLIDEQINKLQSHNLKNNEEHGSELNGLRVFLHSMLANGPFFLNQYNKKPDNNKNNNNKSSNKGHNEQSKQHSEQQQIYPEFIQTSVLKSSIKSHDDKFQELSSDIYKTLANRQNNLQPLQYATVKHKKHDANIIKIKLPLLFINKGKPYVFDLVAQFNIYNHHFGYLIDPPKTCFAPDNNSANELNTIIRKLSSYSQSIWTTSFRKAISEKVNTLLDNHENKSNILKTLYNHRKEILREDHEAYTNHPLDYLKNPSKIISSFQSFIKSFMDMFRNRNGNRLQKYINEASYILWQQYSSANPDQTRKMLYEEFIDAANILGYFRALYFDNRQNHNNTADNPYTHFNSPDDDNSIKKQIDKFVKQAQTEGPQAKPELHTLYERYKHIISTLSRQHHYTKDFDNDHRYKHLFNLLIKKQSHIKYLCKRGLKSTNLAQEIAPSNLHLVKLFFQELKQPYSILNPGNRQTIIGNKEIRNQAFSPKYRDEIHDLLNEAKASEEVTEHINTDKDLWTRLKNFFNNNTNEKNYLNNKLSSPSPNRQDIIQQLINDIETSHSHAKTKNNSKEQRRPTSQDLDHLLHQREKLFHKTTVVNPSDQTTLALSTIED